MLSLRSLTKLLRVFVQQPTVSLHRSIPFTWAEPLWARATYYSARTASSPHVRLVDSTVKGVNVQWGEGDQAQQDYFHGVWLRHNCHCPLCVDQSANQNIIDSTQLDNPSVAHVAVNGNNMELTWRIGVEEHKGYIPLQFLKENHYSDETLTDSKQSRHDEMVTAKMNQIPKICTNNILSSDEELWRWLWNLSEYGMCIINNVPTVPGAAIPLAERISYIQETLYGRILDVVASEKPIDLAYGMGSLPLHSDLVMYESPPGILMLHCIKNDAIGGETLLLDTFPVLEEMRIKHPEEFDTLTRVPATFQRIVHFDRKSPAHIVGQKPHIVLGENEEIVAVNWNQRACGPLKIPSADIEPYYKAYVLLAKLFESSERVHQFRLLPGQVLSINNRRILHGRNAFQGSSRHLQEIFVSTDEFKSRFLVLDAIYGNGSTK